MKAWAERTMKRQAYIFWWLQRMRSRPDPVSARPGLLLCIKIWFLLSFHPGGRRLWEHPTDMESVLALLKAGAPIVVVGAD